MPTDCRLGWGGRKAFQTWRKGTPFYFDSSAVVLMALEKIEPTPQAQALLLRIRVKWENVKGQLTFRWHLEPWPDECLLRHLLSSRSR